jgi:SAM-dependent methyltransferase
MHPAPHSTDWFATSLGDALLRAEHAAAAAALEDVFGFQGLQVGAWGPADAFLASARTRRTALIDAEDGAVRARAAELAVQTDSVDLVLLPHTLECQQDPHGVLREAERVLVGDGHLVVLGFEPYGPWAMRTRLSRAAFVPGVRRFLSERRLRDWLKLLGFEVCSVRRFLYAPPLARLQSERVEAGCAAVGRRLWPQLSGAYLLKAQKRVYTLTPVRVRPRARRSVLGAVEPVRRVGS